VIKKGCSQKLSTGDLIALEWQFLADLSV